MLKIMLGSKIKLICYILSDSQAAPKALKSKVPTGLWLKKITKAIGRVKWENNVPGHKWIKGNDEADIFEKDGANTLSPGPEQFCGSKKAIWNRNSEYGN